MRFVLAALSVLLIIASRPASGQTQASVCQTYYTISGPVSAIERAYNNLGDISQSLRSDEFDAVNLISLYTVHYLATIYHFEDVAAIYCLVKAPKDIEIVRISVKRAGTNVSKLTQIQTKGINRLLPHVGVAATQEVTKIRDAMIAFDDAVARAVSQ